MGKMRASSSSLAACEAARTWARVIQAAVATLHWGTWPTPATCREQVTGTQDRHSMDDSPARTREWQLSPLATPVSPTLQAQVWPAPPQ